MSDDNTRKQEPPEKGRSGSDYGSYGNYGGYRGYGNYGSYGNYGQSRRGSYGGYGNNYGGYGGYGGYGQNQGEVREKTVSISTYINMLRERIWWLLLSLVVFTTASLIYTYNIMPEYRATARLRVFRSAPNISNASSSAENNFNVATSEDYLTAIESMRSSAIIDAVSRQLTIAEKKQVLLPYQGGNIFSGPLSEEEVFGRQRSINPQRSTLVVAVEFTHPDRELARQVTSMFCKAIQKNSEDERLIVTNPLVEKYRIDIDAIEERIRKLYEARNDLVKSQKLMSIARDTNTLTAERSSLVRSREDARKSIDELEIIWRLILESKASGKNLYDISQVRADERVATLGARIADLRVASKTMEKKYTDEHPTLIQTRAQLEQTVKEFDDAVSNSVNRIQAAVQQAHSSYDAIVANLDRKEEEVSRLQVSNNELERLDKDIAGQESFLARQKQNFEEAKLRSSTTGTSTSIKLLDAAYVPDRPTNKNYTINTFTGVGLGLVFGVTLIVFLGMFDDRIKSPEDVETILRIPLLGTIPQLTKTVGPERALLAQHDKDLVAVEAVRAIYSSMHVNPATMASRVFLATSTRPGEGKTFVVTNLALVHAQHGEKVLVIDADLRLPNVGPSVGLVGSTGISRWFNDESSIDEAIVKNVAPNLDVLPVGMSCRNPTQVINNEKFVQMLNEMRMRYDRIFIDSPPLGAVSDALNLIPNVDGVIYIVRYNAISTRNASDCITRMREVGVPIFGAILNRMSIKLSSIYTDSFDSSYERYYAAAAGAPEAEASGAVQSPELDDKA